MFKKVVASGLSLMMVLKQYRVSAIGSSSRRNKHVEQTIIRHQKRRSG